MSNRIIFDLVYCSCPPVPAYSLFIPFLKMLTNLSSPTEKHKILLVDKRPSSQVNAHHIQPATNEYDTSISISATEATNDILA